MDNLYNLSGQFEDSEFIGVPQVDRTDEVVGSIHHADHALYQVIDVAEGTGLRPVTEDGDVTVFQGLDDKVADNAAVVRLHPRSVGVEDPHHPDVDLILPVIIEEEGLGAALAFVIAGSYADGVDVAPVVFLLGVNRWVAIYFAGGGLEYPCLYPFCQPQHVDGAHDTGLDGLYRVVLIVDRRSGAGQVVYLINFEENGLHQIMTDEFEIGPPEEVAHVLFSPGEEIVQAQDVVAFRDQAVTEVGTEETGTAGN